MVERQKQLGQIVEWKYSLHPFHQPHAPNILWGSINRMRPQVVLFPAGLSRSGELSLWMKRMSPSSAVMCLGRFSGMVKKGNTQVFSTYTSRFGLSVAESGQMFGTRTVSFGGLVAWRLPLSISAEVADVTLSCLARLWAALCSASRIVLIALKYFCYSLVQLNHAKEVWLHQKQNPSLCWQLNPAQPPS